MAVTPAKLKSLPLQTNWEDATACKTMQKIDRCVQQATAKLELFSDTTHDHKVFLASLQHWRKSVEAATLNFNLLFSERFGVEYSSDGVITNVSR